MKTDSTNITLCDPPEPSVRGAARQEQSRADGRSEDAQHTQSSAQGAKALRHVATADPAVVSGKKILFVAANFFNIPGQIIDKLTELGATVFYYDERPNNSVVTKTLIRFNRNLISRKVNKYYDEIIEETRDYDFDYIFIIKGECVSAMSLSKLKSLHPRAKMILYQWDSVNYNPQFHTIRPYFDSILSFDPVDCNTLGLRFLPLFYSNDYERISRIKGPKPYDLLFVGTVHFDRYQFLRSVVNQIKEFGGKVFTHLYFQHRLLYLKKKYVDFALSGTPIDEFKFTPMSYADLLEHYAQCRIVVDIQKPQQRGLTLRCLEALGANRKIITTNTDIANYDFYDPRNVLIVDRRHPSVDRAFFDSDYVRVPEQVYRSYSIDNWIGNIFNT